MLFSSLHLTWMISAFEIGFDLFQSEPHVLELALRVQLGLIHVVRRLRVGALPEDEDGARANLFTDRRR
jgi:hypothetical protein